MNYQELYDHDKADRVYSHLTKKEKMGYAHWLADKAITLLEDAFENHKLQVLERANNIAKII